MASLNRFALAKIVGIPETIGAIFALAFPSFEILRSGVIMSRVNDSICSLILFHLYGSPLGILFSLTFITSGLSLVIVL